MDRAWEFLISILGGLVAGIIVLTANTQNIRVGAITAVVIILLALVFFLILDKIRYKTTVASKSPRRK